MANQNMNYHFISQNNVRNISIYNQSYSGTDYIRYGRRPARKRSKQTGFTLNTYNHENNIGT